MSAVVGRGLRLLATSRSLGSVRGGASAVIAICSPLVSVAPMTHTMMFSPIVVRALVGPWPVLAMQQPDR